VRQQGAGRGPKAPPRRPVPSRAMGIVALAVSVAATGGLTLATVGSSQAYDGPPVPFDPGGLAGVGPEGRWTALPRLPGDVLLYVSQTCPHCLRELESWAASFAAGGFSRLPTVVLSPSSDTRDTSYLPPAFRESWVHDRDGMVARRLKVRAVPFVAVLGDGGTVVAARAGRSSGRRIQELLHGLDP
jgi:hypothetical protein